MNGAVRIVEAKAMWRQVEARSGRDGRCFRRDDGQWFLQECADELIWTLLDAAGNAHSTSAAAVGRQSPEDAIAIAEQRIEKMQRRQ